VRNVSDKSCRENQNTYFVFSKLPRKSYRLQYNVEKYCTAEQATDDDKMMRHIKYVVCVLNGQGKNSETLLIFNTYCFPRQHRLRERASMLRHIYTLLILLRYYSEVEHVTITTGWINSCERSVRGASWICWWYEHGIERSEKDIKTSFIVLENAANTIGLKVNEGKYKYIIVRGNKKEICWIIRGNYGPNFESVYEFICLESLDKCDMIEEFIDEHKTVKSVMD
jgi:hypothetical protein